MLCTGSEANQCKALREGAVVGRRRAEQGGLDIAASQDTKTATVLQHLARVPYSGDVDAYIAEASAVVASAARNAVQPLIDRLQMEADLLETQFKQSQLDFEAFLRMATPRTVQ